MPAGAPSGLPDRSELAGALADPAAYPHRPERVELIETHVSLVFLAGDLAYKVKKSVDLGFLDFTTPELRRVACESEVHVNAALAPGVYRRVVPITRERDGSLRVDGAGEPVEAAVEMVRLPAAGMLDARLDAGAVDNELIGSLATLLAAFHARAATGPGVDEHGEPDAVAFNVEENFRQTERFTSAGGSQTVSPRLHAFLRGQAERALVRERSLLARRVREGRIRDGHGDLHAGNVCVTGAGIVVYDRIEFAPRFRCGDVACDLAFLAMDLDVRGFRGFSEFLVRSYAGLARDPDLAALMPLYKGYRAMVRAKVTSIAAADQAAAPLRERRRLEAMRFYHLAAAYELPPALVLMCGLPASGKTTVARALAAPFEAVLLRSDVRRKQQHGLRPTARAAADFGRGIYTEASSDEAYGSLLADAGRALQHGRTVVVDAAFATVARRRPFVELARRLAMPVVVVEVGVPAGVAAERLVARAQDPREVSDADLAVYRAMRDRYEPPREPADGRVVVADGTRPGEEAAAATIDALLPAAT